MNKKQKKYTKNKKKQKKQKNYKKHGNQMNYIALLNKSSAFLHPPDYCSYFPGILHTLSTMPGRFLLW